MDGFWMFMDIKCGLTGLIFVKVLRYSIQIVIFGVQRIIIKKWPIKKLIICWGG